MDHRPDMSAWDARYAECGAVWGHFPTVSAEETWWRLRSTRANRVLVSGCGYGRHVAYFARRGFDTTGLDASRTAIELAHEAARVDGLEISLTCASATRMPFSDAAFDAVYDHALLHHLGAEEREQAVREYVRVLRPGGLLVVSVLSVEDPDFGLGPELEPGTYRGADGRLEHFFTAPELAGLLDGFEVDSVICISEPADDWGDEPRKFVRAVARRLHDRELAETARSRMARLDRLWGKLATKARASVPIAAALIARRQTFCGRRD